MLNYEKVGKNPKRITKIKSFINKYKWKRINFLSEEDDQKKLQKSNVTIVRKEITTFFKQHVSIIL